MSGMSSNSQYQGQNLGQMFEPRPNLQNPNPMASGGMGMSQSPPTGGVQGAPPYSAPSYPSPMGGYWNQISQMLAGPGYQSLPQPQQQPMPTPGYGGMSMGAPGAAGGASPTGGGYMPGGGLGGFGGVIPRSVGQNALYNSNGQPSMAPQYQLPGAARWGR